MPLTFTRHSDGQLIYSPHVNELQVSVETLTRQVYNVKESTYGAVGDGVANDSTAIQAAIDAASAAGGGIVYCPPGSYKCNVTLKAGVTLQGATSRFGYLASGTVTQTKLIAAGAGAVIDTPVTQVIGCGVDGINVAGLGAGTAVKGIRFRYVTWGSIRNVHINNVADEGILVESPCVACEFDNLLLVNCVQNRSRAAIIGAFDLHGSDHYVSRVQGGIGGSVEGTVQSASLYCVGFAIRAAACFILSSNGEFSDIGLYVSGIFNKFSMVRSDLNYGHGWQIVGGTNKFSVCDGINNGQDTTNVYSNFQATSASSNNIFVGCTASDALTKKAKYGFEDLLAGDSGKNSYASCISTTAVTAQFKSASVGSAFFFPSGSHKTLTVNSATPDVTGYNHFLTLNTTPTTITNFTGGVNGQRLLIRAGDANTTIQHNGSTIVMLAGSKKLVTTAALVGWYEFVHIDGVWFEVGELPLGVSADNGDAAKTIQTRIDGETQRWNTPLTANRAVTLSTTGAFNGAAFRIVRTAAATGGSTLDVGTGPLKSLAAGQWCDVDYTGSAWFLSAAGSL